MQRLVVCPSAEVFHTLQAVRVLVTGPIKSVQDKIKVLSSNELVQSFQLL